MHPPISAGICAEGSFIVCLEVLGVLIERNFSSKESIVGMDVSRVTASGIRFITSIRTQGTMQGAERLLLH
jgi:hypothetical protein